MTGRWKVYHLAYHIGAKTGEIGRISYQKFKDRQNKNGASQLFNLL